MIRKRKIINDPLYGLIDIPYGTIFDVIEHPWFQRLRRVKQLGLSHYVYPGATHTRFEHVLGAMHLMTLVVESLRAKGAHITQEEALGVTLAILLHDIGHGPFSHTLEHELLETVSHEELTLAFMKSLNQVFVGELDVCIAIFENTYPKKFLHQLVSSQLDMDRLDYLGRDSFYSGVSEGVVAADRIIKMLVLHNDQLVVEAKGIYSIENFLIARRLMYWQVYLHKTAIVGEKMLKAIMQRAKQIAQSGESLFASPALWYFLSNDFSKLNVGSDKRPEISDEVLRQFAAVDDTDIVSAIKVWMHHPDKVLAYLSQSLINRNFYKIEISNELFPENESEAIRQRFANYLGVPDDLGAYGLFIGSVSNHAYSIKSDRINILLKNGEVSDIGAASDMFNIDVLSKDVRKYYRCIPRILLDE